MLWVRHMGEGLYAVDNDKRWDVEENVLSDLVRALGVGRCRWTDHVAQGRVMEKMLTSDEKEMARFMTSSPESAVSEEERTQREAYHYSKVGITCTQRESVWLIPYRRHDRCSCVRNWTARTAAYRARERSISRLGRR